MYIGFNSETPPLLQHKAKCDIADPVTARSPTGALLGLTPIDSLYARLRGTVLLCGAKCGEPPHFTPGPETGPLRWRLDNGKQS